MAGSLERQQQRQRQFPADAEHALGKVTQRCRSFSLIVADSALYTAKTLQDLGDFPWIMRVLETIGGTRAN